MMALVDNSNTNTFIFNIGTRPPALRSNLTGKQ